MTAKQRDDLVKFAQELMREGRENAAKEVLGLVYNLKK